MFQWLAAPRRYSRSEARFCANRRQFREYALPSAGTPRVAANGLAPLLDSGNLLYSPTLFHGLLSD